MTRKQKKMLIRVIVSAAATVLFSLLPIEGIPRLCIFLGIYLLIGWDILRKAALGIWNRRPFDENFLMAIATVGAFALALLQKSGDYTESIAVMLFYQIGEFFQNCALRKSRKSIGELMDIRPDTAHLETDAGAVTVSPEEVAVGQVIAVYPGEKIPLDGAVIEGHSTLNTVALTGESLPRSVAVGDSVVSGCVNQSGLLRIRTEKVFGDSTVTKILELVENAASRKSSSERFISRFARYYTPAVCAAALALAILPPLVLWGMGTPPQIAVWLYRALTFLVISCPCALVISIPLSFFAGIGCAGSEGILVKGANYLEALASVDTVVFDKTGTLTQGCFRVNEVQTASMPREELTELAALAESASSHPIAACIREAVQQPLDTARVREITELGGNGVVATVDGKQVAVGNEKLMKRLKIAIPKEIPHTTVVYIAVDEVYGGLLVISDQVKAGAADAIADLKQLGIERTVMLTGDTVSVASAVAEELGIQELYAELLPSDKVNHVERLLEKERKGHRLAFVGDGINDAPVLARADIGIAMGALGSDAAIEAADVVLMDDNPARIAQAIRISKKCLSIVKQNIIFSLAIKLLCLGLVAFGLVNMWLGIFADVGVMVLAVLNAIRAMKLK